VTNITIAIVGRATTIERAISFQKAIETNNKIIEDQNIFLILGVLISFSLTITSLQFKGLEKMIAIEFMHYYYNLYFFKSYNKKSKNYAFLYSKTGFKRWF
jgi:hypothetical protein